MPPDGPKACVPSLCDLKRGRRHPPDLKSPYKPQDVGLCYGLVSDGDALCSQFGPTVMPDGRRQLPAAGLASQTGMGRHAVGGLPLGEAGEQDGYQVGGHRRE